MHAATPSGERQSRWCVCQYRLAVSTTVPKQFFRLAPTPQMDMNLPSVQNAVTHEHFKLGEETFVYRFGRNSHLDNQAILAATRLNCRVNAAGTKDDDPEKPGLQSQIIVRGGALQALEFHVLRCGLAVGRKDPAFFASVLCPGSGTLPSPPVSEVSSTVEHIIDYWLFVADRSVSDEAMGWHTHKSIKTPFCHLPNGMSWSYYLQVPSSESDPAGHIQFRVGETGLSFLPRVGDLFIFPPTLQHRVRAAPKSSVERIVLAGGLQACAAIDVRP